MAVKPELITKIADEALKSLELEESGNGYEVTDIIKFYRGVFCNKVLSGSVLGEM